MKESSRTEIESIIESQQVFFRSGLTRDLNFRLDNLKKLKSAILKYEERISEALWLDLHKSPEEAYLTEISIVLQEIDYHTGNLKKWSKPKRVKTPFTLLPSRSSIYYEPLGTTLIVAPWNYPFQLLFCPLIGAISSGCCALLKSSPKTPHTDAVMAELISVTFDPGYIAYASGGRNANLLLLEQRFDLVFFTGGPSLGKIVMQAASTFLTPVVLELGGKSPCIVDAGANIEMAARRIAWGKCINAGQTCIAPDYLFVHRSVKDRLIAGIIAAIEEMYGSDIKSSRFYPRIVNAHAMERLQKLMHHGKIIYGGATDESQNFISPTIIDGIEPGFPIMQEEIFGPLLPVLTFEHIDEVTDYVNKNEKPLAFYYFGPKRGAGEILGKTSSGGGCINDNLLHFANHHLPFGGVGNSGMNNYHGHTSFLAFSNQRGILTSSSWIDIPVKYPPFKYFKWVKKIIG